MVDCCIADVALKNQNRGEANLTDCPTLIYIPPWSGNGSGCPQHFLIFGVRVPVP
jgi:hypothetical protein